MNNFRKNIEHNRRSQESVLYEICKICDDPTLSTHIMYRCNLSFTQLRRNLDKAKKGNYILEGKGEKNRLTYSSTRKGRLYKSIEDLLMEMLRTGEDENIYQNDAIKKSLSSLNSTINLLYKLFEENKIPKINIYDVNHRSPKSVIRSILSFAEDGKSKEEIISNNNLSSSMFERYIGILSTLEMIKITKTKNEDIVTTTHKGSFYIPLYDLKEYLLQSGEGSDPFKSEDSEYTARIEAVLQKVLSIIPLQKDINQLLQNPRVRK